MIGDCTRSDTVRNVRNASAVSWPSNTNWAPIQTMISVTTLPITSDRGVLSSRTRSVRTNVLKNDRFVSAKRSVSYASAPYAFTSRAPDAVSCNSDVSSPCASYAARNPWRRRPSIGFRKPRNIGATTSASSVSFHEIITSTETKATSDTVCFSRSAIRLKP